MISVCMATYNGAKYIKDQIDSILIQLKEEDELIISDDGSNDDTIPIIHSLSDKRIKLYHNKGKHGVIWNFENALRKAKGDYIFLCDQDDVWHPHKVESILHLLQSNILVVHNATIIDGEGESKGRDFFQIRKSKGGYWNNIWRNSFLGCCMCFRAELLPRLFPFPTYIEMHDRWIGLMAQLYGKVYYEPKCLINYRVHGSNVSNSTEKSINSPWKMLTIRLWLIYYTSCRYIKIVF